jgi:hypothetical protein
VYVAEVTSKDKVTQAYSLLSTSNQLTVFAAPLVGASLYAPRGHQLRLFGYVLSSETFPALLPALGNAAFIFGSLATVTILVRSVSAKVRSKPA